MAHHVEHGEEKFPCQEYKKYAYMQKLSDHQLKAHKTVSKCNECDNVFSHTSSLRNHMRSKHEHRQHVSCQYCKKTFVKRSLRKHEKACKQNQNMYEVLHHVVAPMAAAPDVVIESR